MLVAQMPHGARIALFAGGVHSVTEASYACLFLIAVTRTFQMPVRGAVLPDLVPPEALSNAITWNATMFETANVGGPALAGILLAMVSSRTVYTVQAACSVIVLLCLSGVNFSRKHAVQTGSALEGMRFIRNNKLILTAVSARSFFAYLFGVRDSALAVGSTRWIFCMPARAPWAGCGPRHRWAQSSWP